MKKAITLGLVLLLVLGSAIAVHGAAQKVTLVACPINHSGGLPGGGFVIFNNSSGDGHNLGVTVSLKGAAANTPYDIYVFLDGGWLDGAKAGTITTNARGNANFHLNAMLTPGSHILHLDITLQGSGADVYETPGIHGGGGTVMVFK